MTSDTRPRVHDLLRLGHLVGVRPDGPAPTWVEAALPHTRWVVVRRSAPVSGSFPAGMRGRLRSERCALWAPEDAIAEILTPEGLVATSRWQDHPRSHEVPAIGALGDVAELLRERLPGISWGPTGSVGLELASGEAWATASSDLDLIVRAHQPLARALAMTLLNSLTQLSVHVDMLIETPLGGVALREWADHEGPWLLRTSHGPRFVLDPWEDSAGIRTS